jgi:hypothetical protein
MRLHPSRAAAAATLLAVVALAAGCGGGDETKDAFEEKVVAARDTADSSLGYIKRPSSTEDLIKRLRTNGDRLATASTSISDADAPEELTDEQERLARALTAMSNEMDAAANSIELVVTGPSGSPGPVQTLVFETWDTVQAVLNDLRADGIDVLPLRPGGGP